MRVSRAKADCKQADDEFHTARMRERAAMAALKQAETRLNVEREVVGDDEELQRAADALASARSDEAAAQEQLQAAMRRIAELEEQVAEARQAPDAASERRVRAEDRLQELAGEVQRVGLSNEKAEAQLARATRDAEAFRKELDKTKVAVDELQSQAERICSSEAGEASLRDSIALVRRQGNATSSTPSMDELQVRKSSGRIEGGRAASEARSSRYLVCLCCSGAAKSPRFAAGSTPRAAFVVGNPEGYVQNAGWQRVGER